LGIALGRTLWRVVADSTPLLFVPPIAGPALAVTVPASIAVANLLAALPARRADGSAWGTSCAPSEA
jgi:hypothetical protein